MFRAHYVRYVLALPLLAVALLVSGAPSASAHARYERSEPMAGDMVETSPFVVKVWFNQELMSASTISVVDQDGVQVDLADGHVDLDDPDRKVMVVSLPELPMGVYTVNWNTLSAEDGDWADGRFAIGVGMMPPPSDPQASPTGAPHGGVPADLTLGVH
jgi:methionine-rich copper-binding protein CopC